ncbi:hypothetical protein HUW46_00420 [Amycolatopsis sp. CA-230715]|nr:hypothetical protein HUW46_00420 [Amycolatopsis sp. CA-230715]
MRDIHRFSRYDGGVTAYKLPLYGQDRERGDLAP